MRIPEISVQALGEMLNSEQQFVLLDVREPWEVDRAAWEDERLRFTPLSQLAQRGIVPLEEDLPVVVVCHHGIRSRQIGIFLEAQGFTNLINLEGGVEDWALQVDQSMQRY